MASEKKRFYSLLVFLGLAFILTFFILRPFLYPLILSMVFAVVFQPLYRQILKRTAGRSGLSAFLTVLILIIFILLPLTFLSLQIFQEAETFYLGLMANNFDQQFITELGSNLSRRLAEISPSLVNFSVDINLYLKNILVFLVQNLGVIFSNLARIFVSLAVFLIAFFFLLKDGDKLKRRVTDLSPLSREDDEAIIKKITMAINSVIKGNLLVAILEGISFALAFLVFGIPNPVMWGSLAMIGALIPGVGTGVVLALPVLYLYFTGSVLSALGFLFWGVMAIALIDNLLGPKFIGRGIDLHPFLILLSVFGGLIFFGPTGFVLGPITVCLLFVLLDIYSNILSLRDLSD